MPDPAGVGRPDRAAVRRRPLRRRRRQGADARVRDHLGARRVRVRVLFWDLRTHESDAPRRSGPQPRRRGQRRGHPRGRRRVGRLQLAPRDPPRQPQDPVRAARVFSSPGGRPPPRGNVARASGTRSRPRAPTAARSSGTGPSRAPSWEARVSRASSAARGPSSSARFRRTRRASAATSSRSRASVPPEARAVPGGAGRAPVPS